MLGEETKGRLSGGSSGRKAYLRSASWTARSPSKPDPIPNPTSRQSSSKARSALPPLQPLSITRQNFKEWPKASSDDLGIWPQPQTPRGFAKPSSNSEKQPEKEFQFKKDKLAFFDKECSRIVEHIYLGSDAVAKNRDVLKQNKITHVLNCVGFVCLEYFKSDFVYKTLWLQDSPSEDITSILYDVFDYFEDVREQNGRVFVHCCQGVSRSTSLVIAYLMWSEGQSFEDAFQYVKAARGVTNPNMGFACQLVQCQKRVHAVPASPNSILRIYRMAPHSPYDPLHLVPKMLSHPGVEGLDSRGAFVVHIPSIIYVWEGKNCSLEMVNMAMKAASQVIRYEKANGPIMRIKEGEEPFGFWDALASGQILEDGFDTGKEKKEETSPIAEKKVDDYDLDFEIFHKALSGGVVPPFSVSSSGSENCLPARDNGWDRVRRKFANGIMKEFFESSTLSCDPTSACAESNMTDTLEETERGDSPIDLSSPPFSPTTYLCGSPDSFACFLNSSPDRISDTFEEVEQSLHDNRNPPGSPDSFYCSSGSSPKLDSKSPTLSPSNSDYASSFTFSPSSSNWSDLSYLSSHQLMPSGFDALDSIFCKNSLLSDSSCLQYEETSPFPAESFLTNHNSKAEDSYFPSGPPPLSSIAQRRGSNPPPRMLLPTIEEPSKIRRNNIKRSVSFSLPDLHDDLMEVDDYSKGPLIELEYDNGNEKGWAEIRYSSSNMISKVMTPALYQWPTMSRVEMHHFSNLDSKSVYMLLIPDENFSENNGGRLFFWLGRDLDNRACDNVHSQLEMVRQSFIKHMGLTNHTLSLQIIREGKEPELFLKHLNSLMFQQERIIAKT